MGALLAPGKRTVSQLLRVMGLAEEPQFQRYHRVLNRAVWSSRQASRILLRILVTTFAADGGESELQRGVSTVTQCVRAKNISSRLVGCAGLV